MKVCPRQHKNKVRCVRQDEDCRDCIREDKEHERRIKRDLKLEEDRVRQQVAYNKQLQDLQDELEHERRVNKYKADELAMQQTLEQRRRELEALKESRARAEEQQQGQIKIALRVAEKARIRTERNSQATAVVDSHDTLADLPDTAEAEWNHLKEFENAFSKPMDILMSMIGLEDVKQEFLSIKSKVDTAVRQGISLTEERFSCSMLGNPGTGKSSLQDSISKAVWSNRVPRQNHCGKIVCRVSHRRWRHSRKTLCGNHRSGARSWRCFRVQEVDRQDSQRWRRSSLH